MSEVSGTSQQLPFTPAIDSWLSSQVSKSLVVSAGGRVRFLLITFAIASILPAILSVVLLPKGDAYTPSVVFLWGAACAIGALVAAGGLVNYANERRDLRAGVFIRWTGPFQVRLVSAGRYGGQQVQFRVGGRDLRPDGGIQPLYSIQSGAGQIDYLPRGGVLLEVRDESGRTVWSRVAPLSGEPAQSY